MIIITLIFLLIQLLTLIGLLKKANYEYVGDLIVTTALFIFYTYMEFKYNLYLNNYIRTTVVLELIGHNFLGKYIGLYSTTFIFDKAMHIFGAYAFTLFAYSIINQLIDKPFSSRPRRIIFIILLGISLGALFETTEFLLDLTLKPKDPYQPSLIDTNLDLIFNLIGVLIAVFHLEFGKLESSFNDGFDK